MKKGVLSNKQISQDSFDAASNNSGHQEEFTELTPFILSSSQSVFYIVQDRKFKVVTPQLMRLTGLSREELLRTNPLSIVHPQDQDMVRDNAVKMLKGQRSEPYEFRFLNKEGNIKYVKEVVTSIVFNGKPATLGNWIDLTEPKRMESKLKISEERYRHLFDNLNDAAFLTDISTGKIVETNQQGTALLGMSRDEIIGRHQSQIHPPDKAEQYKIQFTRHATQGLAVNEDGEVIRKDGTIVPVTISASRLTIHGKHFMLSMFHDITKRKQIEQALQESERFNSSLLTNSPNPITVIGPDTSIIYVNSAFEKLTKFTSNEVLGVRPPYPWWPEEFIADYTTALNEAMDGSGYSAERELQTKTGERFWAEFKVEPVKHNEKLQYLLLNWVDITSRKHSQIALKESESRYRSIFESVNDIIILLDKRGNITDVNDKVKEVAGYERQELIGRSFRELTEIIPPKSMEVVIQNFMKRLQGNVISPYEVDFVKKNGDIINIEINAVPFIIDKEIVGDVAIFRDISAQKKALREIKESEEKFSKAFRLNPSAISITTRKGGTFLDVNDAFTRDFGYTREEVIGHRTREFNNWVNLSELKNILHKLRIEGKVVNEEFSARVKSGEIRTMLFSAENIDIAGEPSIIAMTTDISGRKKIEQDLKESEEKFYKAFHSNPNSISVTTQKDGTFLDVNDGFITDNGYNRDEVIGHSAVELQMWVDPAERKKILAKLQKNGKVVNEEYHSRAKSGEIHTKLYSAEKINITGEPCVIAVTTDITELRRTEQALRESEEKFSVAFRSSPEMIAVSSLKTGNYIDVNDSFILATGYSREELVGHPVNEINMFVDQHESDKMMKLMQEKGQIRNEEFSFRMKSSEVRHWLCSSETITIGGEQCSLAVATDITEGKQAMEALKESEEFTSNLLENSPNPIVVINPDTSIRYVNPAFEKLTGFTSAETVGEKVPHPWWPKGEIDKLSASFKETMASGGRRVERKFQKKNGESFWVDMSVVAVIHDGVLKYNLANWVNIDQRKKMEDELKQHKEHLEELVSSRTEELKSVNEKLEQELKERQHIEDELRDAIKRADTANRAKSEFLARMSHEIRTPIHGVMGSLDLMKDTELNKEQQQYVNMSKASAETLLNVINDILDFSKIEAGKLEVENKEFELHNMLEETMEAMAVSAHHKGLEIILQLSNGVPEKLIGDAGHLRQILINLIGNAVKFTKQGEIVLRVEVEAMEGKDIELHLSIKDTGIGIQKEKQEILFKPFEQVDGSSQRKYGGSGLGLSICKQLVTLMGGRIWFKSWPEEGSVFHFTVKFKKSDSSESDNNTKTPEQLTGINLLLVDDNSTYRSILRNILNGWGIIVTEADSAHSALKEVEDASGTSRSFRIILMDEEMPGVNGLTAAGQIVQSMPPDSVLVMMLPSDNISDDFAKCQELSISHYLVKPIKKLELLNIMLKALGQGTDDKEDNAAVKSAGPEADTLHLNILVAEDNTTSQMIAKKTLEKAGHIVQIASSGVEAIRMLKEDKFDLILMDVEMPEMSGIEATRVIRKTETDTKQHIPIVAMTAYAMKEDRQRCLDAGMDTYISKPVNLDELHKIIKNFSFMKSEETPAVDIEAALKFVGEHKEILKEVVSVFLDEDYPEQLKRLKEGFIQQNAGMVKEAAHSIKGAVRSLGGTVPGEKALRLEEMGRNNTLAETDTLIKDLEQDIGRLKEFYANYDWQIDS